ncbi:MAG: hypothetical protein A3H29_06165 [Acidobacteria bacterium RIFCSPLOWO2_02_FULL_67_21]|nr:MAG: hypothetical protein A3H29_06165 [Acidobacteria bacterium RIFCSPLOWO2_02_FULL_67_21]
MEVTRVRFQPVVEWAAAAACVMALLAVGSLVVREFRTLSAATPLAAREALPAISVPAAVPSRAVSVPMLLLADGKEIRVGDSLSAVVTHLGREAEAGPETVDRSVHGDRMTRFYRYAGTQFVLVFEPFAAGAEARVAAIYLR